jgi:hypothetical protein
MKISSFLKNEKPAKFPNSLDHHWDWCQISQTNSSSSIMENPKIHLKLKGCRFRGKFICKEENSKSPIKISGNKFLKIQPKRPKITNE